MEVLWKRFSGMYGLYAVTSRLGPTDDGTWLAVLQAASISPEMVGRGLRALAELPREWPPNVTQFRRLCLGHPLDLVQSPAELTHNTAAYRPISRALAPPPPNRSVGNAALDAIRAGLGMAPKTAEQRQQESEAKA